MSNPDVSGEKQTYFCRGKADLSETGHGFSGFLWVCLDFLKAMGNQILAFRCDREFDL